MLWMFVDVVDVVDVEMLRRWRLAVGSGTTCLFTNTAPRIDFPILKLLSDIHSFRVLHMRHKVWLGSSSSIFNCRSDWST